MHSAAFQANRLITLITDFGFSDPCVGVMKGVLLTRHPTARLVDLTHEIPAFQPALAGFWLARIWPHFPAGTVHIALAQGSTQQHLQAKPGETVWVEKMRPAAGLSADQGYAGKGNRHSTTAIENRTASYIVRGLQNRPGI